MTGSWSIGTMVSGRCLLMPIIWSSFTNYKGGPTQWGRINVVPDYYIHETDDWLVFPHELEGLTPEEVSASKPIALGQQDSVNK